MVIAIYESQGAVSRTGMEGTPYRGDRFRVSMDGGDDSRLRYDFRFLCADLEQEGNSAVLLALSLALAWA